MALRNKAVSGIRARIRALVTTRDMSTRDMSSRQLLLSRLTSIQFALDDERNLEG